MTRLAGFVLVLTLLASPAWAQSMPSAIALRHWANAVNQHDPGHVDPAVAAVAGYTYAGRLQLNPAMERFFRLLRGETFKEPDPAQQEILNLFESVRHGQGVAAFIRRAAVLHTDAAIFADRFNPPRDDAPATPAPRPGHRAEPPPPLLFHDRYVQQSDGRILGEIPANWNWPFARSLVDLLGSDRAFAGEWYHAVDAYMMAVGDLADLKAHLEHAATVLPDDARILFDRGCRAEILGLSYNQAVRDDTGYAAVSGSAALPSESRTNSEAETLFRRALEIDPDYAEARVRLARLLQQRGRSDDAIHEIEQAFTRALSPTVNFFAHLVGGRIEESRGHSAASLVHYRAALALFPDAQSALLGASQAAVMASDVAAAQELVGRLGERTDAFEKDPWWSYHLGPGRDVDALVGAVWARAKQS